MKGATLTLGLMALLVTPAVAQWLGEPVWNSPSGGTGVTISGDYAHPNADYGKGNTWGGRASLGIGTITLTAGVASWKPDLATESFTSIGGNAGFRPVGGSLPPVPPHPPGGGARTGPAHSPPPPAPGAGALGVHGPPPTPLARAQPALPP